ncbi:MAG: hypothetical protein E4H30_02230 [Methanomassiliicoccus sp.]|nr:MAG: hypothetical protein E4H30_02230 [Methanomassiliicoccus sp.]
MNKKKQIIIGFVAGGFVAFLGVMIIMGTWEAIEQRAITAGYGDDGSLVDWAIRWGAIAIIIGLGASFIFPYVSARLNWTRMQYLFLSIILMMVFDLLAYLPIYDSSVHIYPVAILGLNAVFFLGFGSLIPNFGDIEPPQELAV